MFRISEGTKLFASCLLFATILYLTTVRTIRVYHVPVPKETIQFGLCDFHNAVYFPGLAFARGENPYSSAYAAKYPVNREMSPYAPMLLPFCAVLGVLPLPIAEYIWYSTNVFLIFVLACALLHMAGTKINATRILLVASVILLSRVGQSNQILGQFGIYFCLFTLIAIRCARSATGLSALGVAFASIKPTFGIPLILLMLAGRKLQPVAIGVLIVALGSGLSLSWMLLNEPTHLMSSFASSQNALESDDDVDPASAWMRTDLLSVVARNLSLATDAKSELLAMLIILIPAFFAQWKLSGDRDTEETRSLEQSVVFLAIPMCIYHLSYDLLLLFPAVVLALSGRIFTTQKHAQWYRAVYIALLVIPLMNYFATHSVMERFHIQGALRELAISLTPLALLAANIMLWMAVMLHRTIESNQEPN
jgi:Glycosyltransferase family 87